MNRKKQLRRKALRKKQSIVNALFLAVIVIGVGFMSWAIFNIWTQSHNVDKEPSKPNTFDTEKSKSEELNSTPVKKIILYPVYPAKGDNIGSVTIPAINTTLPIFQGTDEKELKKGVGHYSQSVLPGEEDNSVLSGHRETTFRELGKLKIGDLVIVKTSAGTFTYKVSGTRIVHADDRTVIVPTDHAVLTMTTCYPFNFIGKAPDRFIVSSDLIKSEK